MSEPLSGDNADEVREIAQAEVLAFAKLLLRNLHPGVDGGLEVVDWQALNEAIRRFEKGESA